MISPLRRYSSLRVGFGALVCMMVITGVSIRSSDEIHRAVDTLCAIAEHDAYYRIFYEYISSNPQIWQSHAREILMIAHMAASQSSVDIVQKGARIVEMLEEDLVRCGGFSYDSRPSDRLTSTSLNTTFGVQSSVQSCSFRDMSVSGTAQINSLHVTGDLVIDGDVDIAGDVTIDGDLTVNGEVITPSQQIPPNNIAYVQKSPITAPNQFNSIGAALAQVTALVPSATNPFLIMVTPGIYIEDELTLVPYVTIAGSGALATVIQARVPNQNLIIGAGAALIRGVTLLGAIGSGFAAIVHTTPGNFIVLDSQFGPSDTLVSMPNPANESYVSLARCQILALNSFRYGVSAVSPGLVGLQPGSGVFLIDSLWNSLTSPSSLQSFVSVSGSGMFCRCAGNSLGGAGIYAPGGIGFQVQDGAFLQIFNSELQGFDTAISVPAVGAAPLIIVEGGYINNSGTYDLNVQHSSARGSVVGALNADKIVIVPNAPISLFINDPQTRAVSTQGNFFWGEDFALRTNIAPLFNQGWNTGIMSGGALSLPGGLNVQAAPGSGYYMITVPQLALQYTQWSSPLSTTVPDNMDSYIFVDSTTTLQSSLSLPNPFQTILLGKVRANSGSILYAQSFATDARHTGEQVVNALEKSFGVVYVAGSQVISEPGNQLQVTNGDYVYGSTEYFPTGSMGLPVAFSSWYAILGGYAIANPSTTVVDIAYDNSGVITPLVAGEYAKHGFYISGSGGTSSSFESYQLVYATETYPSLAAAESGNLPVAPSSWGGNYALIAAIIVDGTTSSVVETINLQPFPSFRMGSSAGVTVHGNLAGLLADDHPQYLLTNGGRVMTGNLDVGNNNIVNAAMVNGMVPQAHASRHLPLGADPLATAVPVTIGTVNSLGIQNSFSRSDHLHNHGSQTDPTQHAVATSIAAGFMSASDKTNLDNLIVQSGDFILQGGNSFGTTMSIGTNDVQSLALRTNGVNQLAIASGGGITTASDITVNSGSVSVLAGNLSVQGGGLIVNGATSGSVTVQSPSVVATYSLTMPATQGTANQVLAQSGTPGILTWVTTGSGTVTSVTASSPLASSGGTTPNITIQNATTTQDGALTSTDWNTFNNKVSQGGDSYGTTMSIGTNDVQSLALRTNGTNRVTIDTSGNVTVAPSGILATTGGLRLNGSTSGSMTMVAPATVTTYSVTMPPAQGTANQVLTQSGTPGTLVWATPTTGTVTSVTATSPLASSGGATPNLTIQTASASQDGALSSADWTIFNNKVAQGGNSYGTTMSIGTNDVQSLALRTNGTNRVTIDTSGNVTVAPSGILATTGGLRLNGSTSGSMTMVAPATVTTYSVTMPSAQGTANQVLTQSGTPGTLVWTTPTTGTITSVTASSPLASSGGATPNLTIQNATTSQTGALTSTDWNTFNNKVAQNGNSYGTIMSIGTNDANILQLRTNGISRVAIDTSGNLYVAPPGRLQTEAGLQLFGSVGGLLTIVAPATVSNSYTLTMPSAQGTANQVLAQSGTPGILTWTTPNAGTVTGVTATSPLASSGGATPNLTIQNATTSQTGALTSTDWNTFNNKVAQNGNSYATTMSIGTNDAQPLALRTNGTNRVTIDTSGNVTVAPSGILATTGGLRLNGSTSGSMTMVAPATVTTYSVTMPSTQGTANQVLAQSGTPGTLTWTTPNAGTVTGVTATSPLASSGGATPNLTIQNATTSQTGALTSTDWNTFNNKVSTVTASSPLASSGGTTPNVTIQNATTSQTGALTSTDWNTFNNKVAQNGNSYATTMSIGTNDAQSLALRTNGTNRLTIDTSGDVTVAPSGILATTGGLRINGVLSGSVLFSAQPSGTVYGVVMPGIQGAANQVLAQSAVPGILTWATPTTGTVTSVTATSPLASSGGATPNLTIQNATTSQTGALTSTDWNTFNNKVAQNGNSYATTMSIGTNDAQSLALRTNGTNRVTIDTSGNVTVAPSGILATTGGLRLNGSTSGSVTMVAPATVTTYSVTMPSAQGTANQVLAQSAVAGTLTWTTPTPVQGLFGWANANLAAQAVPVGSTISSIVRFNSINPPGYNNGTTGAYDNTTGQYTPAISGLYLVSTQLNIVNSNTLPVQLTVAFGTVSPLAQSQSLITIIPGSTTVSVPMTFVTSLTAGTIYAIFTFASDSGLVVQSNYSFSIPYNWLSITRLV